MPTSLPHGTPEFRVGNGYDLHRLGDPSPFIIGGVEVSSSGGAVGHSDADVVMHALVDALLGAIASGDIGQRYPNTDHLNRNANSARFVTETMKELRSRGWEVVNVDMTIVLEHIKIAPFTHIMIDRIAAALGSVEANRISVKSKTNEGVDAIGSGNAVACYSTVLVMRGTAA
jgi:2-C-methyl-D-erythritol 2,4-cyclodiphosphate synthase